MNLRETARRLWLGVWVLAAACARPAATADAGGGAVVAAPAPVPTMEAMLIIWGGGQTRQAAETSLAELNAQLPKLKELGVSLAAGFPRIDRSDSLPGLNPGFEIVALGACHPDSAAPLLRRLKASWPAVYGKKTRVLRLDCPELAVPAALRARLCEGRAPSEPVEPIGGDGVDQFSAEEASGKMEDAFCAGAGAPLYETASGWSCLRLRYDHRVDFHRASCFGPRTGTQKFLSLWCAGPGSESRWFHVEQEDDLVECNDGPGMDDPSSGKQPTCAPVKSGQRGRFAVLATGRPYLCLETTPLGGDPGHEAFELAADGGVSRAPAWPRECDRALP